MSNIRLNKIIVENPPLSIQNGNVIISDTSESIDMLSGALNVYGGIGIYTSFDAVSSTSGGALTVGGGLAVNKTAYFGGDLVLDSSLSTFEIAGLSTPRFLVGTEISMAPDGANKRFELTDTHLKINLTSPSVNLTTAAMVVSGGVSINSLLVGGDTYLNGDLTVDQMVSIGYNNSQINLQNSTLTNDTTLGMHNQDFYLGNSVGNVYLTGQATILQNNLNVNNEYSSFNLPVSIVDTTISLNSSSGSFVTLGGIGIMCTTDAESSTSGGALTVAGGLAVAGTTITGNQIQIDTLRKYPDKLVLGDPIFIGDDTSANMLFTNEISDFVFNNSISEIMRIANDGQIVFNQNYTLSSTDGSLQIGNNTSDPFDLQLISNTNGAHVTLKDTDNYIVIGTGSLTSTRDLFFQNQLTLGTDGNSSIHNLTVETKMSINSTETATSSSGALLVMGGASFGSNVVLNADLNLDGIDLSNSDGSLNITSDLIVNSQIQINSSEESVVLTQTPGAFLIATSMSDLTIRAANGLSEIDLHTDGNITLSNNVHISGDLNANGASSLYSVVINSTADAIDINSTGSLYVQGGSTIDRNLIVNGLVTFTDTTPSTNTQGALTVAGGLSILSGQQGSDGAGALTVNGGGYFGESLFVQQDLNVYGVINGAASSSTFAYLSLTATDGSLNLSTGTLVTFGGLTTQCYLNAQSVSNGGSFLTPGGASIGKDLYLGGNLYGYGTTNLNGASDQLINFFDLYNTQRFSIDRDVSSSDFSITRYDSLGNPIEKSISISNEMGNVTLNSTIPSTSAGESALIVSGGLSVAGTQDAVNLGNGGALTVMGGASISGKTFIGGDTLFASSTSSTNSSNGSVVMMGGLGIAGNLNVRGDVLMSGNVAIMGTMTSIHSTDVLLSDNLLLLNAAPAGSSDSGVLIRRYQVDNDSGFGDVVADAPYITDILPLQSGMSTTQIKLSSNASSSNDYYTNWWIEITSGFGANQVRKIVGYTGSTRIAVLSSELNVNPANGDNISLFNKPFIGMTFSEIHNRFEFGSTIQDLVSGTISNLALTDTLPIYFSGATSTSTEASTSVTSGGIVMSGGLSSSCTADATSITAGGSLTLAGGAGIAKSVFIGEGLNVNGVNMTPNASDIITPVTFTAANNTTTGTIPNLAFGADIWGFDLYLSVQVSAATNLYSNYHIRGVNKGVEWELVTSYVGDPILVFAITSDGKVLYSCPDFNGFNSMIFKYRVITV